MSVGGGVGFGWNHPGITNIEMQTKSSTTVEGIQGMDEEIDGLVKNAATRPKNSSAPKTTS